MISGGTGASFAMHTSITPGPACSRIAQSTRFVQFPGITLKSGMQDREVRIV